MEKNKKIIEFGDFQTPLTLAKEIAILINKLLPQIDTIIEPTCGIGNFLQAFIQIDSKITRFIGWEINPQYVQVAQNNLLSQNSSLNISIKVQDFFEIDWFELKKQHIESILFVGNPPWITNTHLMKIMSKNLPSKNNFQGLSGLEAITGKSNFDISEWMLIKICQQISATSSAMAFLVKTSVARKVYQYINKNNLLIANISIYEINAKKYFNVNTSACLFFARGIREKPNQYFCHVYDNLYSLKPSQTIGISNNKLIANINTYENLSDIDSVCEFKWRSGIKHDASKIMEFNVVEDRLINGKGEIIDIPDDYLYPMYKSSDIGKQILSSPTKKMLVTQKYIGCETSIIEQLSPQTWQYLMNNKEKLDSRKSSIYKKAPRFAIFGVGEYSFKPWKIVISSLYKNIYFHKISLFKNKPIVLDDTCYLLAFDQESQTDLILTLLNSKMTYSFINSLIFYDNKRIITTSILNRINLRCIALKLNLIEQFNYLFTDKNNQSKQLSFF